MLKQIQVNSQLAGDWATVTPDDANDLDLAPCLGLRVNDAGTVTVVSNGGNTVTFTVAGPETLPIKAMRVKATGTTATDIIALY